MSLYVVSRENSDFFESDASRELVSYLGRICDEQVSAVQALPEATKAEDTVVILGDVCVQAGESLPKLEGDAIQVSVRKTERGRHVRLRGGSSRAIRHAAYRFLEECGVLFDLMDDYLPDRAPTFDIADCDIREKPLVPLRGSHVWINFPMDPSGYSREQWMRYVRGCVRLRHTILGFHFYNNFPWFDYELDGERKQGGYFFYGHRHPLPEEPDLRYGIRDNERMFVPPECEAFAEDGPALHAWCQETLRLVMAEAHRQGMKTSVTFEPFAGDADQETRREHAYLSFKAIVETYPDLDIIKLVAGEGARVLGTNEELTQMVKDLVGGDLKGTNGKEVSLPFHVTWRWPGNAAGVVVNCLRSSKLSYETVLRARKEGVIRPGLEVAIGGYPGSMEALPAIFGLIGKVVPDPSIKLHFLPAHGMARTAKAMGSVDPAVFAGRKLEISGWTELDGMMYYPQYCVGAIERMRDACVGGVEIDALYAIHWRTAGTTLSTAFFTRSLWDAGYTQDRFWQSLGKTFGSASVPAMRQAFEIVEQEAIRPAGFCYYRCWQGMIENGRSGRYTPFPYPNDIEEMKSQHERNLMLARQAQLTATTESGRRLCGYLVNKNECALVHQEYCRLGRQMAGVIDSSETPGKLNAREEENMRRIARRMVDASYEYIRHYQKWMFDRGDEGMIASYYMTATRYAWRYAYPEQDDATGKFCDLSKKDAEEARIKRRKQLDEAVIHAPEMDWKKKS